MKETRSHKQNVCCAAHPVATLKWQQEMRIAIAATKAEHTQNTFAWCERWAWMNQTWFLVQRNGNISHEIGAIIQEEMGAKRAKNRNTIYPIYSIGQHFYWTRRKKESTQWIPNSKGIKCELSTLVCGIDRYCNKTFTHAKSSEESYCNGDEILRLFQRVK